MLRRVSPKNVKIPWLSSRGASLFIFLLALSIVGAQYSFAQTSSSKAENFTILVDDFNKGITYNSLGGKNQGDEELPGGCVPSFTVPPVSTRGLTGHSLKLDYNVTIKGSFSFYYTLLGAQQGETKSMVPLNLEGYDYLSFWVMSPLENLNFKIFLYQDQDDDGEMILGRDISSTVKLPTYYNYQPDRIGKWQKVVIPLEDFGTIYDFTKMLELAFTFESRAVENEGTLFVDDILFGKGLKKALEVDKTLPFVAPYGGTLKSDNAALTQESILSDKNNISVEAPSRDQESRLESVRFEYSPDKGLTWHTIATDYDLNDNVYTVEWDAKGLNEKLAYSLRAVSCSILGEEAFGEPVVNLHIER
jgi:hypothetical protein